MKVLIVNTVETARNGITNVIFNYIEQLKDFDVVFDLVTINDPDHSYIKLIENSGGRVHVIPRRMKKILQYFIKLKRLIRKNRYDLVHVHGNSHTMVIELLAAKLGGCKVRIAHAHNTKCNSLMLHKFLSGGFNCLCTHRLACGNAAGLFLHGRHPFLVMCNGINVARFLFSSSVGSALRIQYDLDGCIVLGHVGKFDEVKNQSFLLDILSELLKTNSHYRLMLIGEGPMQDKVKEKAENLQLTDYITFVGSTDRVADFLSAMDMIVMPSLHEGLPLTLVEAQANGLPCLVSENITREVDKTGSLTFLPLDVGAACWAQEICEISFEDDRSKLSHDAIGKIKACGYDIHEGATALYRYYKDAVDA